MNVLYGICLCIVAMIFLAVMPILIGIFIAAFGLTLKILWIILIAIMPFLIVIAIIKWLFSL